MMIQAASPSILPHYEYELGLGALVKARALFVSLGSVADGPFAGQQIDAGVGVGWDVTEPACELVDHDSRCDAGGVDRAAGCAGSLLGFGCSEKC